MSDNQRSSGQNTSVAALPFAAAVRTGDLLFISGQIGVRGTGLNGSGQMDVGYDFGREVRQVMENIGQVLQQYGLQYSNLVQVTIYLTDMGDYGVMNQTYREFFRDGFPTRVCIAVKELPMQARIEASAIASFSLKK